MIARAQLTQGTRRFIRRGVAAVEAAVTLPVLMTLLLGVWEVGRMLQINATLTYAGREAARMAAGGVFNGQPVTVAIVQQQVKDYLAAAGFPAASAEGAVVTITNLSGGSWTNPCDALPLDRFRITITIPPGAAYDSLRWSPISRITGANSMTISADWLSANDSLVTVNDQLPH
jgi:Flp pilus assembly protein TadG